MSGAVAIRWKATLRQWRFREIATAKQNQLCLAMTNLAFARVNILCDTIIMT